MVLSCNREIESSIISTTITIDSFGTNKLTAEEEKEVLLDYKITIPYGKLLFSRYVTVNDHGDPQILNVDPATDEPVNGDLVTLSMPIETYELTEDFELRYAVDINKLDSFIENYEYITDTMCAGKAMIAVFEDVVVNYIHEQLEISRKHKTEFETIKTYVV